MKKISLESLQSSKGNRTDVDGEEWSRSLLSRSPCIQPKEELGEEGWIWEGQKSGTVPQMWSQM